MTTLGIAGLVAAATATAAGVGLLAAPGRADVAAGAALGAFVAGVFTLVSAAVHTRIRAAGGAEAASRTVNAVLGLMLARMLGYLTFLGGAVALKAGEPVSVCLGLAAGTILFMAVEIMFLRKRS
ncbi:MAG TPA: hypothetical protein VFG76_05045 [Candidatus Polarisedimenticolia bacterium]|nr:hypothetical protein [Candidatus Polarisedimenticolia bacterium]